MQIVTSVRAYQWPYTLYVFRGAAGRNSAETLYETTNRENNIFSAAIHVVRFKKMYAWHFFVLLINTCKDYTYSIIKTVFILDHSICFSSQEGTILGQFTAEFKWMLFKRCVDKNTARRKKIIHEPWSFTMHFSIQSDWNHTHQHAFSHKLSPGFSPQLEHLYFWCNLTYGASTSWWVFCLIHKVGQSNTSTLHVNVVYEPQSAENNHECVAWHPKKVDHWHQPHLSSAATAMLQVPFSSSPPKYCLSVLHGTNKKPGNNINYTCMRQTRGFISQQIAS